ncbi:proteinase-activated receptor 1-like [Sinocyclocheilus rhinocerous]|uniref:proteinase-activated receptor 1-like n=1 Tax=Sinocyclocheilus rhinocerous TaxID=307959 RepID=UPI0007B7DE78|nr:PREDICTED: proteinase-activated receptor 1-like [Sinocyclocheilus rhinocerous]
MAVKTILFSIILLHACTATFNESSVSSFEQTDEPVDDKSSTQTSDELSSRLPAGSGRNFSVMAETNETRENDSFSDGMLYGNYSRDYFGSYALNYATNFSIFSSVIDSIAVFADPIIIRILEDQPCNSTDLNAVDCNKTTQHTYNISDESVDFLKGLLVTRVMPSFYIIIILISLPLNTVAFVAFTCRIREKKPAVIYMSHLACVDLLFTLLLPLKIHYQLNASDWVFGEAACRVLSAAYYCYMYCSILLMMSMSVDRLLAVVFPIASLTWRSTRKATCVCVLVWLLALAGTVPLLSITQTFKIKDVGVTCHDVLYHTQVYAYLFSILSCLYFLLPLIITLVSYSTIIYVLTTKNDHLATSYSDKRRRAAIMAIAVLMEFVMCFTPTNGILLYHCVRLATGGSSEEGKYYLMAVCLGSASVFLDPLLYYYGSSQCREQISSLIWWRKTKSITTPSNTNSQTKSSNLSCEYSQAHIQV